MFIDCPSLIEIDLSNFNTKNVADMRNIWYCFKELNLSNFNIGNVINKKLYFIFNIEMQLMLVGSF